MKPNESGAEVRTELQELILAVRIYDAALPGPPSDLRTAKIDHASMGLIAAAHAYINSLTPEPAVEGKEVSCDALTCVKPELRKEIARLGMEIIKNSRWRAEAVAYSSQLAEERASIQALVEQLKRELNLSQIARRHIRERYDQLRADVLRLENMVGDDALATEAKRVDEVMQLRADLAAARKECAEHKQAVIDAMSLSNDMDAASNALKSRLQQIKDKAQLIAEQPVHGNSIARDMQGLAREISRLAQ